MLNKNESPEGIQVTWSRGQKSEANARRLVACWNACEDLPTAWIEGGAADILEHAKSLKSQRDGLLEALKFILKWGHCQEADDKARTAIAKAEASK